MHSSQKRSTFAALNHLNNDSMEMNKVFKDGLWSKEINVSDFVYTNITPYEGDASFLAGPTERTKKVWNECLKALEEERANNGVRSLDNVTVSTCLLYTSDAADEEDSVDFGGRRTLKKKKRDYEIYLSLINN